MLAKIEESDIAYIDVGASGTEEAEIGANRRLGISREAVAKAVREASVLVKGDLSELGVSKATVEFGLQFAVESGQVVSVIAKGSGSSSLKVCLEWIPE